MRIVHIQTTVQSVFGVLDDEGNVAPQPPIEAQVTRFSPDAFLDAHALIGDARDKAAEAQPDSVADESGESVG